DAKIRRHVVHVDSLNCTFALQKERLNHSNHHIGNVRTVRIISRPHGQLSHYGGFKSADRSLLLS
ncbi:hypothetical protein ACJMK2_032957, partial [Sinanodonta woodiana]